MGRSRISFGTWIWAIFAAIGMLLQLLIVYESMHPHFVIYKDSMLYVCSTGAQVVAGMYGLTLTGYVFYADKLQKTVEEDESLRDIVEEQKKHNFVLIMFISAMSLISFLSSTLLLLYGGGNTIVPAFWHRLVIMETCMFTFQVVTLIIYFVLAMLDPNAIERGGQRGKQTISSDREPAGSVQAFLKDYQEMELRLQALQRSSGPEPTCSRPDIHDLRHLRPDIHDLSHLRPDHRQIHQTHGRRKPEEILAAHLPEPLFQKVLTVRKYHNYLIHTRKWTVTRSMCDMAAEVNRELRELGLSDGENSRGETNPQ